MVKRYLKLKEFINTNDKDLLKYLPTHIENHEILQLSF